MSIFTVPEPFKGFFETFPLFEHPPVQQITNEERNAIKSRLTNFISTTATKPSPYHFKLAIYNTFVSESQLVLATDPLCLSLQLQLAVKRGLKLNRAQAADEVDLKANSLFVISHHGSEDGLLPIYIEQGGQSGKSVVKTYQALNEQILTDIESSKELLLTKLVDVVIYDFYLITALLKVSQEIQMKLYTSGESTQEQFLNSLGLAESLSHLVKRNGFDLRYPNIAAKFQNDLYTTAKALVVNNHAAIETEFQSSLKSFKNAVSSLSNFYRESPTKFFNDDQLPSFIDVKLASYITISQEFLNTTDFSEEFNQYPELSDVTNHVLKFVS